MPAIGPREDGSDAIVDPLASDGSDVDERRARRDRVDAALRGQDWSLVYRKLVAYAFTRCRSQAHAEDLAQEAMRRVLDPAGTEWDPSRQPRLIHFLGSLVNGLLRNERTSAGAQRTVVLDASDESSASEVEDTRALSSSAVAERDLCARRVEALRARLLARAHEDALALAVFEKTLEGAETPLALAAELGRPVDEIVFARRRMHRAAAEVARSLHGALGEQPS